MSRFGLPGERTVVTADVPLHGHTDNSNGGKLDAAAIGSGTFADNMLSSNVCLMDTQAGILETWIFVNSGSSGSTRFDGSHTGVPCLVLKDNDTNKLINFYPNTFGDLDVTFTASGDVVTRTASQVLTNKTLTTPIVTDLSNMTHNHQNAAGGGSLDAAAIGSGVLSAARVYAGTCKLTGDLTDSVGTLTDATGLSFSVAASSYYAFEFLLVWQSNNSANGIKLSVTTPSSPTVLAFEAHAMGPTAAGTIGTAGSADGWESVSGNAITLGAVNASSVNLNAMAMVRGILVNGANAGTLQLQFAGEDGVNTTTLKQGSCGFLRKLP